MRRLSTIFIVALALVAAVALLVPATPAEAGYEGCQGVCPYSSASRPCSCYGEYYWHTTCGAFAQNNCEPFLTDPEAEPKAMAPAASSLPAVEAATEPTLLDLKSAIFAPTTAPTVSIEPATEGAAMAVAVKP